MKQKLVRIADPVYKTWAGVCVGFAYYFGVSPWPLRAFLFLLFAFFPFLALGVYIYFWFFLPTIDEAPKDYEEKTSFRWL